METKQTKILKEEDLRQELDKATPKLRKMREVNQRIAERLEKLQKKLRDGEKEAHKLSEHMAGRRGLISHCVDGKIEVIN